MKRTIVQKEDPVLRKKAKPIAIEDIPSAEIQKLIVDMRETLAETDTGVAIAAPQVGETLRLFIISENVFEDDDKKQTIYINPKITRLSRKKEEVDEGCLSVDGKYGSVKRHEKVTVEAINEKGEKFTRHASDLLAQIIQHEIDHLNGTLYTDIAEEVHDIPQS